jgi:hypothetical protein
MEILIDFKQFLKNFINHWYLYGLGAKRRLDLFLFYQNCLEWRLRTLSRPSGLDDRTRD